MPIKIAVCAVMAVVAVQVKAQAPPAALSPEVLRHAAALQSGYYEELDVAVYENLEAEFGDSARVFASTNVVRFGNLEVRAKLVVPRSDEPRSTGFMASDDPQPVRVMLDYALVSCGNGCVISILSDRKGTPATYKAKHEAQERKRKTPAGGGTGFAVRRRDRTASMVVIEGKQAREVIHMINGSRTAHVFLTTAVHGAAHFEFNTASHVPD